MVNRDLLLILLGAAGFIIISHQIPILRSLGTSTDNNNFNTYNNNFPLERIEGIDLSSLRILRERGLM